MSREDFKELILIGKSKMRYQLVNFILNILHVVSAASCYCCCKNREKSKIYTLPLFFTNFEKNIDKNIFDYNFLFWYYTKLCNVLFQLFDQKKDCVECFLGEYEFRGRDRHTGKYLNVSLFGKIRYNAQA